MRAELRPEEIAHYREAGFLVVHDFLDGGEVETWRRVFDRATARVPTYVRSRERSERDPARAAFYAKVFDQRTNLHRVDEEMRALLLDERIGRMVAGLAGVEGVRLYTDQALVKPPYGNPTAFHLDNPYHAFRSPHCTGLWVALDDATVENGCLYYVPGTHLDERYETTDFGPEIGAIFDLHTDWASLEPVACPVPAGGALFHNGLTAHGAGANMTPHPRRAMTATYMPVGATFSGHRHGMLTEEQLARWAVGDAMDDEDLFPLAWRSPA